MKSYKRIIFVAKSGTCREPMAAEIFRDIGIRKDIEVLARGLVVLFPEPLNQKAEAVMISNGLPVEGYMSAPLTAEDITEDTLILTMEDSHRQKVLEMFDFVSTEQVQALNTFVGDELEMVNPYGGSLQMYGLCYETLLATIRKLVNILNEGETEGNG